MRKVKVNLTFSQVKIKRLVAGIELLDIASILQQINLGHAVDRVDDAVVAHAFTFIDGVFGAPVFMCRRR